MKQRDAEEHEDERVRRVDLEFPPRDEAVDDEAREADDPGDLRHREHRGERREGGLQRDRGDEHQQREVDPKDAEREGGDTDDDAEREQGSPDRPVDERDRDRERGRRGNESRPPGSRHARSGELKAPVTEHRRARAQPRGAGRRSARSGIVT